MLRTSILISFFFIFNLAFAQTTVDKSFFNKADAFWSAVVNRKNIDYKRIKDNPSNLLELVQIVDNAEVENLDDETLKAFYINAYNLAVVKAIVLHHPIQSVQNIPGFFDQMQHKFMGKYMTLNEFEKGVILKKFKDPRLHFALVCGAKGCPPISSKAYRPETLDLQLNDQCKAACDDPEFIRNNDGSIGLSKIFEWYAADFGGSKKNILKFINEYRTEKLESTSKISYYDYDWSLNQTGVANSSNLGSSSSSYNINSAGSSNIAGPQNTAGSFRYLVSALYEKGQYEVNIFNNLYHEKNNLNDSTYIWEGNSTFFTTLTQVLFGINNRINVGFDLRFRSVRGNNEKADSPFETLKFPSRQVNFKLDDPFSVANYSRVGLTAIGPKVKYTPFKNFGNISIQHTLYIPLGKDLSGNDDFQDDKGYIDWDGGQLWTQMFYDQNIGNDFAIFVEADLNFENVGTKQALQFSTPLIIIPSYFPNDELTFYGLIGSAPQWFNLFPKDGETRFYNPYSQYGLGVKYLFAGKLQLEVLVTDFLNSDSTVSRAATYNFGVRYIRR